MQLFRQNRARQNRVSKHRGRHWSKHRGQAYIEYIIGAGIMAAALFTPIPSAVIPEAQGMSAVEYLIDAFKRNHQGYIWAMSAPSP